VRRLSRWGRARERVARAAARPLDELASYLRIEERELGPALPPMVAPNGAGYASAEVAPWNGVVRQDGRNGPQVGRARER